MTAHSPHPERLEYFDGASITHFVAWLFEHVDWQGGGVISLLGLGEKNTSQDGAFKERIFLAADHPDLLSHHAQRWGQHNVGAFIVPAVVKSSAAELGQVGESQIQAFTALVLDIDNGDIQAKAEYVTNHIGPPSLVVESGGVTADGQPKKHLYWRLNEPTDELERVGRYRKLLAAKVGGDQAFGRITQIVRLPGSVHSKADIPRPVRIVSSYDRDYELGDLCDAIDEMRPMEGSAPRTLGDSDHMDFSAGAGKAATPVLQALTTDIHECGSEEDNRHSRLGQVVGHHLHLARLGVQTVDEAFDGTIGWAQTHMKPPYSDSEIRYQFDRLLKREIEAKGPISNIAVPPVLTPNAGVGGELPIEFFGDIKPGTANPWLVRDLLPQQAFAVIFGDPGAGKSFLALDIALRVAAGLEVYGHRTVKAPVVYLAAEGQGGFRKRVAAARLQHQLPNDTPFVLIPSIVDLQDGSVDMAKVVAAVEKATAAFGQAPGLIVIDTLAATFGAGDENSKDMLEYVNNLAALRDRFKATVMVVHHKSKDPNSKTPRGHSSLLAAADTTLQVRLDKDPTRVATVDKQKDGEGGQRITFELVPIVVGQDDEGMDISSPYVLYRDHAAKPVVKLSEQQLAVLAVLEACLSEHGRVAPETALQGFHGASVSEDEWRAACYAKQLGGPLQGTQQKTFKRAKEQLAANHKVKEHQGRVWIPPAPYSLIPDGQQGWGNVTPFVSRSPSGVMDFSAGAGRRMSRGNVLPV